MSGPALLQRPMLGHFWFDILWDAMIASLDQGDPVDQCGISVGDVKGIATGSIFNLFSFHFWAA